MNYPPRFSIVVPLYNTEKYLRQCVDSILSQSITDFELWLVDDGSKDASIDIIKEYADRDSRVHAAFIHGRGPSEPRNYGLRRATGKYVMFVDSDDYLAADALAVFAEKARKFPSAAYIRGNRRILIGQEEKASIFAAERRKYADTLISGEEMFLNVLIHEFPPTDTIYKTEFLRSHNIEFDENLTFLEDGPFLVAILRHNPDCVWFDEEIYIYRLANEDSLTNTPKTLNKCISLVGGAKHYLEALPSFGPEGKAKLQLRAVEHCMTAFSWACLYFSADEARDIEKRVREVFPKFPVYGRSRNHKIGGRIYNINPALARLFFRTFRFLSKPNHK